ncbi:MAG: branched-chain amino acid ABC transporter permease [Deltaproteobacteria bacterium]|nr:branched-chain amino acid ABC transporter permease [Deltaproteobacteria bacterium]
MLSNFLLAQTLNGLSFAALLFLLSSGLSLIYGVMKIVNIAHGSFFMVGAYVALTIIQKTNNFFLAAFAGGLVVGVLGLVIERGFLRRFPLQPLPQMMITLGFALLIRDFSLLIWGGDPYILQTPDYLKGSVKIIDVVFPIYRIFIFVVAILVAIALWLFNEKTLIGAKLRAAVDDHEMAGGVGLNVPLISGCMFGLGAFLAGFGGVMGGPVFGVFPGLDFELLSLGFVVVLVGGRGSLLGSAVGSILVGLVDNFGKALIPELSYFTLFAPMALVVALKPTGLFGKE